MIAKVRCQNCEKTHNVEMENDLNNTIEASDDSEWSKLIFKCVVFEDPQKSTDSQNEPTIKDAKQAMYELEKDFLTKIMQKDIQETFSIA